MNDTEYISVTFIGQSFMLHQIVRRQSSFLSHTACPTNTAVRVIYSAR